MRAYRLVKARYADTALDGSGAKAHGGRWNSKGVRMVYASDGIALAALELLVHLHRSAVLNQYGPVWPGVARRERDGVGRQRTSPRLPG